MELKEGMYVRTTYGIAKYIHKLDKTNCDYKVIDKKIAYDHIEDWEDVIVGTEILKASNNIIDLIEVGDYVNGFRVDEVEHSKSTIFIGNTNKVIEQALWSNDINSIVTKEQFESMSYKVGE